MVEIKQEDVPEEFKRTSTKTQVSDFKSPADQVIELLKDISSEFLDSSEKSLSLKQRIKTAISALHDKKNFFKTQIISSQVTTDKVDSKEADLASPLESPASASLSVPKNRKLSKIGKAGSVMMPQLNKFSSSDSENELLAKKRRNSGRQSIRVAQTNWLKEFSGLNLA